MKKTIAILIVFAAVFVAVQQAQAQTVSLSAGKGGFAKGKTTRASVVMNIPGGLHVNSNRPRSEYAIPTHVTVTAEGATIGAVSYPPGKMKKFSFSETPISIYENQVSFGFNVTVPSNFSGRMVRLKAQVTYQACTDEVCYPKKTKTVYLNVRVR
ncbi:MAG TPA: protein-disulfide reductase DsbD domain-containing protein [Aridibacter sp.]|nr:protein-disulfide reductase DsbD domain-containing protein [Aridibacter sp.]